MVVFKTKNKQEHAFVFEHSLFCFDYCVLIFVFQFKFVGFSLQDGCFQEKCQEKMHVLSLNMFFMVVHNILIFQLKCFILMPLIP